ncbi:hypothetical protein [Legionella brunensis]|uniref:Fusaric acid resistance protein family protein n=1 Tax=Legionella brunensis TaxID=29422 RepID=A0A0W0SUY3_9GAMM|nr:hypothetical protein [Legionella brunensis]KTC87049.1 hypothetical protein Lbru_0278 [Legionella brunensis]
MFISDLRHWLNRVDPYAIQRVVLQKSLFAATVLTFIYWFFKPESFLMFVAPLIVVSWYEMPFLSSKKEKNRNLLFIFAMVIITGISFYLIYPFRLLFLVYAIIFFIALFYIIWAKFPKIKNATMLIISTGALTLSISPMASLQISIGFLSSALLSMLGLFICLNFFPNKALEVWRRALQYYIQCIEADIAATIANVPLPSFNEEVSHVDIIRSFQPLLPKKYLSLALRIFSNIRNLQFALNNIYYQELNPIFWSSIKQHLHYFRLHMDKQNPIDLSEIIINPSTRLQYLVQDYLLSAMRHWNTLCKR